MKLPPFAYECPTSLDEAIGILATHGDAARPISGGQSLIPMLAFRLAAPSILVDLRRVPGLDRIDIGADGTHLGARVRWCDIATSRALAAAQPLLAAAIEHVAHYQIRTRGTVGGSLAHADPAAELPGIAVACDATIEIAGKEGRRSVAADDFFTGAMTQCLASDELVTGIRFPFWPAGRRWGFEEFAKRRGDFALAGVAVFFDQTADGSATDAHIATIGAGDRPRRLAAAEDILNGARIDELVARRAGAAASAEVDPMSDIHASTDYRRALVGTLLERALAAAARRGDRS